MEGRCCDCGKWGEVNGLSICECCLDERMWKDYEEVMDEEMIKESWRECGFEVVEVKVMEV